MPTISDARILIIATDGFEDSELLDPRQALIDRGASVTLASLDTKEIKGDKGQTITPDRAIDDVDSKDFDALLIPGGTKNPDKLRMEPFATAPGCSPKPMRCAGAPSPAGLRSAPISATRAPRWSTGKR